MLGQFKTCEAGNCLKIATHAVMVRTVTEKERTGFYCADHAGMHLLKLAAKRVESAEHFNFRENLVNSIQP